MKYTLKTSPEGKPAIYCERGIVCQLEAGYQQAREQDAVFVVRACNAHDELVAALTVMIDAYDMDSLIPKSDMRRMRAALAKAKGEQ